MQHHIIWNQIPITIDYNPDYSKSYKEGYGYPLAHIEVRANQPLPITDTGYKSQFIAEPLVKEFGDVREFVLAMLQQEAQSDRWKKWIVQNVQLDLF